MKAIDKKQHILKTNSSEIRKTLLSLDDVSPYITLNPNSITPVLLVCDHASNRFPKSLGTMGLDYLDRLSHITVDIGSRATTESLARQLNTTAILCQYSRLIVDCNRNLSDNSAYLDKSDGVDIPGNQNLNNNEKEIRESEIYWPYHNAIDTQISRLKRQKVSPIIISIHSFTPVFNGNKRECEVGVLWDKDPTTARIFINKLTDAGFLVGDNKPYSGKDLEDFTLDYHAETIGLPHVGIEIRQDLINHDDGVIRISNALQQVISSLVLTNKSNNIQIKKPLR
jgi:predicted N-formylglutamate amidohydrolase